MKNIILSLACILGLTTTGLAQTQRTILYEEFSGETCLGCFLINPSCRNIGLIIFKLIKTALKTAHHFRRTNVYR